MDASLPASPPEQYTLRFVTVSRPILLLTPFSDSLVAVENLLRFVQIMALTWLELSANFVKHYTIGINTRSTITCTNAK